MRIIAWENYNKRISMDFGDCGERALITYQPVLGKLVIVDHNRILFSTPWPIYVLWPVSALLFTIILFEKLPARTLLSVLSNIFVAFVVFYCHTDVCIVANHFPWSGGCFTDVNVFFSLMC